MADSKSGPLAQAVARRAAAKKAADKATKASAKIENRDIADDHVRSAGAQRLLAKRHAAQRSAPRAMQNETVRDDE
jgi:hypothetical protein